MDCAAITNSRRPTVGSITVYMYSSGIQSEVMLDVAAVLVANMVLVAIVLVVAMDDVAVVGVVLIVVVIIMNEVVPAYMYRHR